MHNRIRHAALLPIVLVTGCSSPPAKPDLAAKTSPVIMSPEELLQKADLEQYPGSSMPEGKSSVSVKGEETRVEVVMLTSDSVQKVIDFYKKAVSHPEVTGKGDRQALLGTTEHQGFARIFAVRKKAQTEIQAVTLTTQSTR
jgi:hypothetical protein